MEIKSYVLKNFYGKNYNLAPVVCGKYIYNGAIDIDLYDIDEGDSFASLTVCIKGFAPMNENCSFVDINNLPHAIAFLKKNKLAVPTGRYASSGYCVYPEYEFDLSKLNSDEY